MRSNKESVTCSYMNLSETKQKEVDSTVDEIVAIFIKKELNIAQIESILDYVKTEVKQYKISE